MKIPDNNIYNHKIVNIFGLLVSTQDCSLVQDNITENVHISPPTVAKEPRTEM